MPALNGDGNVLLTNDVICKLALRLLKNNLVYGRIASKRYQSEFADVGETVNVMLAPRVKSGSGRAISMQPMVKKTTPLSITNQQNVGITVTARDRTLSLGDFANQVLKSGVIQLANTIDSDIATKLLNSSFYQSGTAGTAINQDTIIDGMADAELVGMPRDGLVSVVLDPRDRASIAKSLEGKFNEQMVAQAIRKGYIGPIDDVDTYSSANVAAHLNGTFTTGSTPLSNGTNQTGSSIVSDGWANSTLVLKKGDVITFNNVYSVNPQTYISTGVKMQFVVTADVTSNGSGQATIPISPAINDGTLTSLDAQGNSISTAAYQNVTTSVADNSAIVPAGTEALRYRIATMFHRDALALAVPPLRKPETATMAEVMTDPDTGLSISLTGGYDVYNNADIMRLDVIWGFSVVQPELTRRLIGATIS